MLKFLVQVSSNFKFFLFLFSGSLFIYHLSFAALGLHCCAQAFSSCPEQGLLFTVVHGLLLTAPFLLRGTGSRLAGSSSCRMQAQQLRLAGSGAVPHALSLAPRRVGSAGSRNETCVPCISGPCSPRIPFWGGFPDSSVGKESACSAGDPSSIPRSGRSAREGIGYPLQHSRASLVAHSVKNPPAIRETWVPSLGWEDPLEKGKATHTSILTWRVPWTV